MRRVQGALSTHRELEPHFEPVFTAIKNKDLNLVKKIHMNEPSVIYNLINTGDSCGLKTSALGYAATYCANEVAQFLLGCNVDFNQKDSKGMSPMMLALRSNNLDLASQLYFMGADPTPKNNFGRDVTFYAAQKGQLDLLESFVNDYDMRLDCIDDEGFTCLYLASNNGHSDIVKYILKKLNSIQR